MRISIVFILLSCCVFGCSGDKHSSPPAFSYPIVTGNNTRDESITEVGRTIHTVIYSSITQITYPVHIALPSDYDDTNENYPVIYTTDGQWVFDGFANIIANENKKVILVAIEQGPNDRRAIDYPLPGANAYFEFLTTELLPSIETEYRIDSQNRTLVGTSYGGIIAGLALLMDDIVAPHFKNYLSFDPSFYEHQRATRSLEQNRYDASNVLNATLVLTSATLRGNDAPVNWYKNLLEARDYQGLRIIRHAYAVDHNDVANPSFTTALRALF